MTGERAYLDPYLRAAEEFGPGFEALLWRSPAAQKARFGAVAQMTKIKDRVLADIGCGNADLLFDLHERDRAPVKYIGIDGVPQMIEHARELARSKGIESGVFLLHDFVADQDLPTQLVRDAGARTIVFSGSLNTLSMHEAQAVLDRFWLALTEVPDATLIFNFLSDRHDRERTPASPPAVRYDPVPMLEWALGRTPLVTMRHDYLAGHDATICMMTPGETAG